MQSTHTLTAHHASSRPLAARIPKLTHVEAGQIAKAELRRFITLIESLTGDEWSRPTMCTAWSVRDILAHQAGAYASGASFAEFRRQVLDNPYMKEAKLPVDGINQRQLEDREGHSPEALLEELRTVGYKAIASRQKLPGLLRALPLIPFGPPFGTGTLGYLMDTIYTRDTWMHRYDICVATGREMVLSPEHDGRITALVAADVAQYLLSARHMSRFALDLAGPGGGSWQFGSETPIAAIAMDALDFHVLASGRATSGEMIASGKVILSGDINFGVSVLGNIFVPY